MHGRKVQGHLDWLNETWAGYTAEDEEAPRLPVPMLWSEMSDLQIDAE